MIVLNITINVNDTQTRYIYTYSGEDDNNKLTYDKKIFHPYATLDGLGDNIREIKKTGLLP